MQHFQLLQIISFRSGNNEYVLAIISFSARELICYFVFLQGTYFQVKHPVCRVELLSQPKHRNQRERISR